jgi:hypothetical protein
VTVAALPDSAELRETLETLGDCGKVTYGDAAGALVPARAVERCADVVTGEELDRTLGCHGAHLRREDLERP